MDDFEDEMFDCVMSNSLMHHLPAPAATIADAYRLAAQGGRLFIRDLVRPDSDAEVERLVTLYAGRESPTAQQLLRQSFHAALTVTEVEEMLVAAGLPADAVAMTSDRHWTIDLRKEHASR